MHNDEALFFDEESIDRERIITDEHHYILNEFFCPICYCLLWKPRSCSLCQNLFCKKCIQTCLKENSNTCPLCRSLYKEKPPSPSTQSILSHYSIRCRNTSFGCTKILPYDLLEQHESIECKFLTKKCRICEQNVLVTDIDQHKNVCQPILIRCSLCQCSIKRELFECHQEECLQRHSNLFEDLNEELFVPPDFPTETILSTTSAVNFIGIEMFNQSREKNWLIRFCAMVQLILINLPRIHLIILYLLGWSSGNFIHNLEIWVFYLKKWIRTSIYQTFIFIFIFSTLFNYTLFFLLKLVDNTFIILFIIISLIMWSLISPKIQLNFNFKEILLFFILIFLLLQILLLIIRFYFNHIPIHIGTISLSLAFSWYSKYPQRSTIICNHFL
jgi:hypothetical protein